MNTKQKILVEWVKNQTNWSKETCEKLVTSGFIITGNHIKNDIKPPLSNCIQIENIDGNFIDCIKISWIDKPDYFQEFFDFKITSLKNEEKELQNRLKNIQDQINELTK